VLHAKAWFISVNSILKSNWFKHPNQDQTFHIRVQYTSLNHEWESYMGTIFGSMGWDLNKELVWTKMETPTLKNKSQKIFKLKY
jgi:hypothetical protein